MNKKKYRKFHFSFGNLYFFNWTSWKVVQAQNEIETKQGSNEKYFENQFI